MKHIALAALMAGMAIAAILLAPVRAQQRSATVSQTGSSFDPASLPDQEIGRRFTVKAEDLPPPKTGPVVASRSLILPYTGQKPRVPEGFTATAFATGPRASAPACSCCRTAT